MAEQNAPIYGIRQYRFIGALRSLKQEMIDTALSRRYIRVLLQVAAGLGIACGLWSSQAGIIGN